MAKQDYVVSTSQYLDSMKGSKIKIKEIKIAVARSKGHPSDRCLFICKACGDIYEAEKCTMEEFYNLIRQWHNPTKHAGMLPETAEKIYCIYTYVEKQSEATVKQLIDPIDNTCDLLEKSTATLSSLRQIDEYARSSVMMALEIPPGESRGYWKYHVPDKKFKQSKAMGKINNKKATLRFASGAEVSILDATFARKTEGRTRLKITLAGSLVYFFDAWATTDEISEVDINEQTTEPAVERPEYVTPTAILRRPAKVIQNVEIAGNEDASLPSSKCTSDQGKIDPGNSDNLRTKDEADIGDPTMDEEVCIKVGGTLFAEDVEDHMAVLPEETATTEEVKIEDLQIGDANINTQEEIECLVQTIWKRRHLLIGKGNALPPAAKGVLVIIKKNGIDIRLCIDYRLVNSLTKIMVYPMPLINDLLDDLDKVLWYCSLDMASGFWVVTMTDRARSISAFITPVGLFEWNRMPFGLKNAPQIYQRLLDNALYGFLKVTQDQDRSDRKGVFETGEPDLERNKSVLGRRTYIDDILVTGRSWESLCEKVEKLLDSCDEWNLSISVAKSFCGRQKVDYLGHRVSAECMETHPKDLSALQELPFPTNLRSMQSFLGSLNYYSRFIEDFAIYASVLYELREADFYEIARKVKSTGDDEGVVAEEDGRWTEARTAFTILKNEIVTAPIFDVDRQPVVVVYASKWVISAALMQEHDGIYKPVTFTSRTLKPNEINYDTLVAFAPAKEGFITQKKKYVGVGSAYLVGRVCRVLKQSLFQINWLDSQFQNHVETLALCAVQRGNTNYRALHERSTGVGWGRLGAVADGEDVRVDDDTDILEEYMESYEPPVELPASLAEVVAIKSIRFEPEAKCDAPSDLYQHADGSTKTRLRPEFKHIFQHSASSSFFAYVPVSFWQQAVGETNSYARQNSIAVGTTFTLDEVMTFLGILFYMVLIDKGEYANYWGTQIENSILA
ncbi:Reverse transcriptase [Phytophthora palmivora]|uniref:Reverse transcriptase n=1 Tax=Phytophthora palmivora TaxID=4796 RepID=A0A2P4YM96_9STRA|nr:Reverse transcriptase [Phytophthora palmivora]